MMDCYRVLRDAATSNLTGEGWAPVGPPPPEGLIVRTPSPRTCLAIGGTALGVTLGVDVLALSTGQDLPPVQLHTVIVVGAAVLAGAGLVGLHTQDVVELGRRLERLRSDRPAAVVPLPIRGTSSRPPAATRRMRG